VSSIVKGKGKRREARANGVEFKTKRFRPIRTKKLIKKVGLAIKTENPPSQTVLANKYNTSLSLINKVIHEDLKLKTRIKSTLQKLTPKHKENRRINSRKLRDNQLKKRNMEFVVTIDEAWLFLNETNKKKICNVEKGKNIPESWTCEKVETFSPKLMVVGIITGRGTVPLIQVPPKVKINSQYYIDNVLKPLVEIYLPNLYPNELDKVFVHHDAAPSHTSRLTTDYMVKIEEEVGIKFIKRKEMTVKSPDASPLDFFGFRYLKEKLKSRRPKTLKGLLAAAQSEWSKISLNLISSVYNDWRFRLKLIREKGGDHIENVKKIHKKSNKK
jgi:hypothetical protein